MKFNVKSKAAKLMLSLTILCTMSNVWVNGQTQNAAETKGIYSNHGDVYISGTMKEDIKTATILAVKKGSSMSELKRNDIYYADEVKNTGGKFAFRFNTDAPLDGFDTYVYNGEKGAVKLEDYANTMYIATNVDVKTYAESLDYDINIAFNNIFGYDVSDLKVYTAIYDANNMLLKVITPEVSFSDGEGTSNVKLTLDRLTDRASYVKLFAWKNMTPITGDTKIADGLNVDKYTKVSEDTFYDIDSPELYYSGRWQRDDENKLMKSNWTRPYVRVKLTYTNGQKVQFRFKKIPAEAVWYVNGKFIESDKIPNDSKLYQSRCSLNHEWNNDPTDENYTLIDVTKALDEGMNEIIFMINAEAKQAEFSGVKVSGITAEKPMYVYKPNEKSLKMMVIGDSITSAGSGYAVMTPMILNADFVNISRSAIALRDGKSYFPNGGAKYGMESRFKCYESVIGKSTEYDSMPSTPFNFKDEYDIICVNLGTNDKLINGVDADDSIDFMNRYNAFVSMLHEKYPTAQIVCIRPFNGGAEATADRKAENANRSMIFEKMKNDGVFSAEYLHYWDTSALELPYINNPPGDVALHPTYIGHQMITKALIKYMTEEGLIRECDIDNVNFDDLQASGHYGAAWQGDAA